MRYADWLCRGSLHSRRGEPRSGRLSQDVAISRSGRRGGADQAVAPKDWLEVVVEVEAVRLRVDESVALAGVTPPDPYWQLIDIVGVLPDPGNVGPWREAGRSDLSIDLARARLESYLIEILEVGYAHK